ncbi:MAG: hypothetical protein FWE69_05290, partial [Clostridiales bacterium]|nr:hypothetical protein [Clostridiales bacterium]
MKKILSIIVALAMILALVPVSIGVTSAAAGDTYELVTSEPSDWSGTYLWVYHPTTAANGGTTRINKDWAAHFNSTTGANFSAVMEVFPSAGSIPWSSGVAAAEITVTKSDTTGRYHLQRADGYYLGMQGTTSMLASNTKQTVANYQWFFEWNNGSPNAGTDGSGTRRLTWNYNGDNPRCSGYAPSASYISPKLYKFTLAGGSSGDNPYTVHVYGMDGGSVSKIVGDGVDATLGEQVNGWKSAAFTGADVQEVELTGTFNGTGDLTAFGRKLVLTPEFPVAYIFSWGRAGNNTAYATVYAKDNGNGTVTFSVLGYHDSPYSISSNQIGWNTEAPPATPSYNDGFAALTSGALDSKLVPADEDGQWLRLWSGTFPYTAGDFLNEFKIYRWGDVVFPDGEGNGAPLSVSALPCSDGHDGDEVPNPAKPAVVGDCLNEAWSAGTMCSLCGEEITPPIKGSLNPAICACAPGHDCGDTCGCACCAPKTEQDFALTTNLIPGTYVVAAYNNDVTVGVGAITAAYGTPNANWLTSRTVKPSANTVTTGDAEIIWELTGDSTNGFSMYNAANDVWLTIATGTSNPAANISAKGLTNATKPATATFDIFVSTFTSSNPNSFRISSRGTPANVLKLNWGAGYGFRMYADSNAPTGINGTQPTILFYKLVQEECVTHTWGDWGAKVPSTCSTLGVDNRVCSVCSAEQTREALALSTVAPINHAGEGTYYVGGFPAVGITPGYEGDIHCSGCNAKIGEGDPIAPGYQGTFVVITDASDVEAGDKIIVLVNRASGNYWYLAGEPSDSRILAVQDGPATAPTSITNPKYAYVFEVEEAGDNLAIKAVGGSQAGKYITWTAGNVASYGGSAYELKIVDGATTGTWRIQSAADATRYLALNNSAGNDYFAFYTGTTVRLNLTILKLETDNPCAGGHIGEEIDDPENPAVGGTCTTNAYSKGTKWSCCGAVAVAKAEIPDSKVPSNHTGAVIDDPENPAVGGTCTTNAYAKGTKWSCCNVVVQAKAEIPDSKVPSNHTGAVIDDPDNPAVAGTCTTNAYSKGTKWSCCNVIAAAKAEIP